MKKQANMTFLQQDPENYIKFTKIKTHRIIDLFAQSTEVVLTNHFVKAHKQQLQTIIFEYEVKDKHRKWTYKYHDHSILKRVDDFIELREKLSNRYQQKIMQIPVTNSLQLKESQLEPLLMFFQLFLNQLSTQCDIAEQKQFNLFIYNKIPHSRKEMNVYFQSYLMKKAWGRHNQSTFKKLFSFMASWETRFFTITSEGLFFTEDQHESIILDNLIFSSTFSFYCGEDAATYTYGILINSSHRVLHLDAGNIFTMAYFVYFLNKAIHESQNTEKNRFQSFARVRDDCEAKYYIDGQDYFSDLCDELLGATKEIFITGWMISPYFQLKRPDHKQESRLDNILAKVANSGIKINIIIYNAPPMALNLDSQYTQDYLTSLSANIKIMMHPNYVLIPFMWSHHEKMVIIDQKIAFIGGLDLGYGRLDSKMHYLTDTESQFWPGVDYCNYRKTDICKPKEYRNCSIDRAKDLRMPWHDIAVRLIGGSVQDLSRHFIQYWNYVNFQQNMDDRKLLMYVGLNQNNIQSRKKAHKEEFRPSVKYRQAIRVTSNQADDFNFDFLKSQQEQNKKGLTAVFSLQNEEIQDFSQYQSSIYEVSRNSSKDCQQEKEMQFYATHLQDISKIQYFINKLNPKNIINHRLGTNFDNVTLDQDNQIIPEKYKRKKQNHQILRSASMWSLGLEESQTQHSILNAYLELIQNAEEFIYIENQFFISEENKVTRAIYKKILEAHRKNKKFRVIIMLPALPGFEGHPEDENCPVFRIQVHLHLKNINKLYHKLRQIPKVDEYIFFFSLRAHAKLNNRPVTEIIYIHSKIMIVDDKFALIGSANINDRSLNGNRDTELAVVIEDVEKKQIKIGQQVRLVSEFAHNLRKELYMQHFDINESQSIDYHNDIWYAMIEVSKKNQNIYRELFGCYPDDEMRNFKQLKEIEEEADPSKYDLFSELIKGHAVPFQIHFLEQQDLSLRPNQKEYFLPEINFT